MRNPVKMEWQIFILVLSAAIPSRIATNPEESLRILFRNLGLDEITRSLPMGRPLRKTFGGEIPAHLAIHYDVNNPLKLEFRPDDTVNVGKLIQILNRHDPNLFNIMGTSDSTGKIVAEFKPQKHPSGSLIKSEYLPDLPSSLKLGNNVIWYVSGQQQLKTKKGICQSRKRNRVMKDE